jgi:hypothetical protein
MNAELGDKTDRDQICLNPSHDEKCRDTEGKLQRNGKHPLRLGCWARPNYCGCEQCIVCRTCAYDESGDSGSTGKCSKWCESCKVCKKCPKGCGNERITLECGCRSCKKCDGENSVVNWVCDGCGGHNYCSKCEHYCR